ncbi:efflux RND transporter permease subunit [Zongyangia hominis]|uniref:MMPL family transporter n=1 Tax=Zongyangia hominis TaxID=2763677 RepID=A0A926ICI8_9FIRM|nr:MMPL family transporter [Zongyangia hominis]MBC8571170.1 MMPL family transporter [Zongyangia hominis]
MERIARFIVRHRVAVIIVAVLLLIPSVLGYIATYVNYDILSYLPPELESMMGQKYLENDFNLASMGLITVENMPTSELLKLKEDILQVPGVSDVLWQDDVLDPSIPPEILPEEISSIYYKENATLMMVKFKDAAAAASTIDAVHQIEGILRKDCFIGGLSAIVSDTKYLVDSEMPLYVLTAVILSVLILTLGMESYLVPFIFLLGIVFPIVYNLGSNIFLGQISYITKALAAVLQLGVTMDFSIFLLHRYDEELANGLKSDDAMVNAIQKTFASITGSSLTTIAGFLAMCTMSLSLGVDIGIVMAKGVLLGVLSTIIILPALILFFDKPIHKYKHKVLIPKLHKATQFIIRHYKATLALFLVLFVPFTIAQSKADVYYNLVDTLPKDMTAVMGTNELKEQFNMTTTHFVMVSDQLSSSKTREMIGEIEKLPGIESVVGYEKFLGAGIPEEFIPDDVKEIFEAGGKKMILVNSSFKSASAEQNDQLDQMETIVKSYDSGGLITGEGAMTKDLIKVADEDFKNVNITSILAVFLIIAIVFRSGSIPVLLVAAIEFAIMINMGLPYFTGTTIPFVASIVIGTIQLGATVDYAILMTTRFREERKNGLPTLEAVKVSVENCSQSIITSGLTFFGANVGVAVISKIALIKSLCEMISRGALISMLVILFVLPSILIVCSKIIEKTTYQWLGPKKKAEKQPVSVQ